jgi:hypothetical protein
VTDNPEPLDLGKGIDVSPSRHLWEIGRDCRACKRIRRKGGGLCLKHFQELMVCAGAYQEQARILRDLQKQMNDLRHPSDAKKSEELRF